MPDRVQFVLGEQWTDRKQTLKARLDTDPFDSFDLIDRFDLETACGLDEEQARVLKSMLIVQNQHDAISLIITVVALPSLFDVGSFLLSEKGAETALPKAEEYPSGLFEQLDKDWREYASHIANGLELLVPPVLGIVLTRCARHESIPLVVRDLREEWAKARAKVWSLLDTLRSVPTLHEAQSIRHELVRASQMFSPVQTEFDSRPLRVFWDITAASAAGAGIAAMTGGRPGIGALTGAVAQVARSVPPLAHEFGPILFGRGAFDLARRVRRAASQIEGDALSRLISASERRNLGLN
jgi:antitoxin component of RelBE/YafQ-DinJ toxin-antitoxin module